MKLLSRDQIESLAKFKSQKYLTSSFFLDTKKRKKTKKEIELVVKNLLNQSKTALQNMDLPKTKQDSLIKDLEKFNAYCTRNLGSYNNSGMALFSCSGEKFWKEFILPNSPRNRIVFDKNPYVRPLSAILTEYTRICNLIIDRKEAKWYDIYMGEIFQIDSLASEVPGQTKEGGFKGYESKKIERHIASHLREHFKAASKKTFSLFKKNTFDWFILSCGDEYCPEFESLLHPYIKKKLKGHLKSGPGDPPSKILNETLELKRQLKSKEKEELLRQFISELEKGGMSTSGLQNTLDSLNRGEVQTLLITRFLSQPGRICPKCNFLYTQEITCPSCRVGTEALIDVVDQAVESAFEKNCQVKHINPPSSLHKYGDIGAILRFKT
ncbi:hypothetical protein ACFLT9_08920 [Acidobacteriota bacterium]